MVNNYKMVLKEMVMNPTKQIKEINIVTHNKNQQKFVLKKDLHKFCFLDN
jgi:hypothetical protein